MKQSTHAAVDALIGTLEDDDLPNVAAAMIETWYERQDPAQTALLAFVTDMVVSIERDDLRQALIGALDSFNADTEPGRLSNE